MNGISQRSLRLADRYVFIRCDPFAWALVQTVVRLREATR